MPGYVYFTMLTGFIVILMLVGPRRPRLLRDVSYLVAPAYNELPFVFLFLLAISVVPEYVGGAAITTWDLIGIVLAALLASGFAVIAWRGFAARDVVRDALDGGLGAGWRDRARPERLAHIDGGPRWLKVLFAPIVLWRSGVERTGNVSYGPHRRNRLDIYRSSRRPEGAPVLVYFHSGGYYSGNKRLGSAELLYRLADQGWVTISANYRLRPQAGFFDHLGDAKRVIAWVRAHAHEYGADPSTLVLAGGSAGAHLSTIAALTQNDPRYQEGFEEADTSVSAVVGLYGWYGGYWGMGGSDSEFGPLGHEAGQAPPFFIAHGELDTLATVETARALVAHLRRGSSNPVVYAELPGGHHGYDLFYSLRYEAVVDGIEAFTSWLRQGARTDEESGGNVGSELRPERPEPRVGHRGIVVHEAADHEADDLAGRAAGAGPSASKETADDGNRSRAPTGRDL